MNLHSGKIPNDHPCKAFVQTLGIYKYFWENAYVHKYQSQRVFTGMETYTYSCIVTAVSIIKFDTM